MRLGAWLTYHKNSHLIVAHPPNQSYAFFLCQGDKEAAHRMAISPLMDRRKEGVTKSQCDFLERLVIPMFEVWVAAFPDAKPLLSNAQSNLRMWKSATSASKQ